ncbi:MAG: ABC transporter ATP-binding protein [Phycisphaeraceae bacterium]|nr:ABC transporter ATP-binding protein [Phycisphaeraceae bacterium]
MDEASRQNGVEIEGVRFTYRGSDFALRIDRLAVDSGTTVVVVGPSGSGKTTLLNLMAGIFLPDAGRIVVGGTSVSDRSDAARRRFRIRQVGMVFQEFELLEHLTVRENVLLPFYINRALRITADVEASAQRLAQSLGIEPLLRRRPRALSQGERQRVAIARALITEPAVLLADEPTGNLDPRNTQVILDLLLAEARRLSATLFMVTHDHALLSSFDRVIDFADLMETT